MKVVGGALFRNGKLLVIKRSLARKVWPGLWEIPSGRIRPKETPTRALRREFFEETGIVVRIVRKYCTIRYGYAGTPATEDDYIVDSDHCDVTLSGEHTAFRWITGRDIDKLKISPQMSESIRKAFSAGQ